MQTEKLWEVDHKETDSGNGRYDYYFIMNEDGKVAGPLQIPWSVAEKAYGAYAREYGKGQSLERLAERGGFGWCEMDDLYPQWRAEASEIAELRSEITAKDAEIERLRSELADKTVAMQKVADWATRMQIASDGK